MGTERQICVLSARPAGKCAVAVGHAGSLRALPDRRVLQRSGVRSSDSVFEGQQDSSGFHLSPKDNCAGATESSSPAVVSCRGEACPSSSPKPNRAAVADVEALVPRAWPTNQALGTSASTFPATLPANSNCTRAVARPLRRNYISPVPPPGARRDLEVSRSTSRDRSSSSRGLCRAQPWLPC